MVSKYPSSSPKQTDKPSLLSQTIQKIKLVISSILQKDSNIDRSNSGPQGDM